MPTPSFSAINTVAFTTQTAQMGELGITLKIQDTIHGPPPPYQLNFPTGAALKPLSTLTFGWNEFHL